MTIRPQSHWPPAWLGSRHSGCVEYQASWPGSGVSEMVEVPWGVLSGAGRASSRPGATVKLNHVFVPRRLMQCAAVIRWRGPISVPVQLLLKWAIVRRGQLVVGL